MHYGGGGEKLGQNMVESSDFDSLMKAFLLFRAPISVQNFIKIEKNATVGARTDRQTEGRKWLYNLPRAIL